MRSITTLSVPRFLLGAGLALLLAQGTDSIAAASQTNSPPQIVQTPQVPTLRPYSSQVVACLDSGEACQFRLKNGSLRTIRLRSVTEFKDSVIGLARRAEVGVLVDNQPVDLVCAPYVMPTVAAGLRIQADTTSAWLDIPKRVLFTIWDASDPIVDTKRFAFPLRNYSLFSHGTQAYGEPVHLGAGDGDPAGQRFHHDYGFDMAGYEGREEVFSAVAGKVVKFWPSREDPCSVLIQDSEGLIWEHAHLKSLAPELALDTPVAAGQKIGILGKTGPSGNFSHLHVGNFLTHQDLDQDRANRRLNLYPWMVAAYQAQHPQGMLAVARPHQTVLTGEKVLLDGNNSLAWGGKKIVEWRWVFPDGQTVKQARAEKTFDQPGAHVATLWVKDAQGAEDVDFCQIKVFSRDRPEKAMPHIFMTHSPASDIRPRQPVAFRCWFQGEGGGPLQIDFGDGTPPAQCRSYSELSHRFETAGLHIVTAQCDVAGLRIAQKQKVVVIEEGQALPCSPDWMPVDRQRLEIASASASATLSDQYSPARIHDGDRRTKWVCPVRPSSNAPAWIALTLAAGSAEVGAVAVFGERLGNDGILDAEIQALTDNGFKTLASIRNAQSPSWVATFPPVRASQVRLQVLRSSGPTDHTDVWEMLVCGRPLSGAELADLAARTRRSSETNHARLALFGSVRRDLGRSPATSGAIVETNQETATMAAPGVVLRLDLDQGRWDAAWSGDVDAGIARAGFRVAVDGKDLPLGRPRVAIRQVPGSLGNEPELGCVWESAGLRVEREFRLDIDRRALVLGGRIRNLTGRDVKLGATRLLELAQGGGWWNGGRRSIPASVSIQGHSLLRSSPFAAPAALGSPATRSYRSSGMLAMAARDPSSLLLLGYLRADEAAPDLSAEFHLDEGGTALSAESRFLDRVLGANETVELNRLYLAAARDPFRGLESYGDALAKASARPVHTGATSLWCSWYAHRMAMTEEKVLANAEVAARHFQPLGLTIIQLDHGWQRGDITGDWVPNQRFPHGLKWLAGELRRRHGLSLGAWIAPTDVAETSQLYRDHPEWMLRDAQGNPRISWRWYWAPNPNCYELDATQPQAFNYLVDTFRRLSDEGVSYYKIDFIAPAGGEHFYQRDPKATRGWSNLRRAMEAIRAGAGDQAWIRYCQTPPILSAGLAHGAYGGDDTLDAGIPGRFDVLRDNAHALAAGFWLNDRPYHREVCDMSVRMHAGLEEARLRAAIMTLANCSISWSDELCYLPPSRIRLMQQCLPPGNPLMRPLDLFERNVPSVWHLHATNQVEAWDVVGLFNFNAQPETRTVSFARLGLDPAIEYAVFEFWEERYLGRRRGAIELTLPPESSRILSIRRLTGQPQLVGTDMHLLQGFHEVKQSAWDAGRSVLRTSYRRAPGLRGKAFFVVPEGYAPKFDFPLSPGSARLTHVEGELWMEEIEFTAADSSSSIPFTAPKKPEAKEPTGT